MTVNSIRPSTVIFAVTAIALAAVTALALAVIFCPPFFATAALAGCATYLAIGSGTGTVLAALTAIGIAILCPKNALDKEQAMAQAMAKALKAVGFEPNKPADGPRLEAVNRGGLDDFDAGSEDEGEREPLVDVEGEGEDRFPDGEGGLPEGEH